MIDRNEKRSAGGVFFENKDKYIRIKELAPLLLSEEKFAILYPAVFRDIIYGTFPVQATRYPVEISKG